MNCVAANAIIIYDNGMKKGLNISGQIRRRRAELGLSLADIARRAGTSAATLSRYENGWSRFEVYTLRKLSEALDCELHIELRPRAEGKKSRIPAGQACEKLKRLFWDHPLVEEDLTSHSVWVTERVLEFGSLEDIGTLRDFMGLDCFLENVCRAERVSVKTANFWKQILEMEGISCTKKYSRNTAWNC